MRVLLLPSSYPPVLGGLQTVSHALAKEFIQSGHEVRVLTKRHPRSLPRSEVIEGVSVSRELFLVPSVRDLNARRIHFLLAAAFFYPLTLYRLRRLVNRFRPDVVNVHFPDAQIPHILWLRRRFNFRLVVSLHGHEVERWFREDGAIETRPKSGGSLRNFRLLLRESNAIVACSRYLLERTLEIEPHVGHKCWVVPNTIDTRRFKDMTSYRHSREYLLALGRMTYSKGFDMLLKAFADVASLHPEVDLVLAGEGDERPSLEDQANALKLERRVVFYGGATPQQVVRLMNGCLFVVVPSREEAFGLVALEAFAAGKAVLGTRVGGLADLLEDFGFGAVEPSPEGLAQGLRRWLGQPQEVRTVGRRCRKKAAEFDWNGGVSEYQRVLQSPVQQPVQGLECIQGFQAVVRQGKSAGYSRQ